MKLLWLLAKDSKEGEPLEVGRKIYVSKAEAEKTLKKLPSPSGLKAKQFLLLPADEA